MSLLTDVPPDLAWVAARIKALAETGNRVVSPLIPD